MSNVESSILSLEEKVALINQNTQFNITLMWTIFGVAIAIAGSALIILA